MTLTGRLITTAALCCTLFGITNAMAAHHEGGDAMAKPTIVDIAVGNSDFSTLVAALKAADLVGALSADGPFTVFAPTNEAFAALPDGTLEMLLLPENKDKLVEILTYHVVPGKVMAADVVTLTEATSLEGDVINISVTDEGVMVDEADVIATDIVGSNGVIHVIDAVILPGS
ncbi:MAG: fasciclin domain-containing protein [Pseudomonadota bacterium]